MAGGNQLAIQQRGQETWDNREQIQQVARQGLKPMGPFLESPDN